ncbi:hypothetical protein [Actinospongicola halichondriae]|uniref:hypothetical protein n=1 Tax=Actinospongicola halichondriae TaxID=3236844 RepID=UPI003D4477FA
MAPSSFRKGALFGSVGVLVVEGLVVVAVVVAWMVIARDDTPDPTAARRAVFGTVTSTEPNLCVEGEPEDPDRPPPEWCGPTASGMATGVTVGDLVEGTIIGVELDPGSGFAWTFWESLTLRSG